MLGGDWCDVVPAERIVKALQASRRGEVRLLSLAYAGQRVEIGCLPATIFGQQPGNELRWRTRIGTHQILPGGFRRRSTRNENSSGSDTNLATVKIQYRCAQNQFLRAQGL